MKIVKTFLNTSASRSFEQHVLCQPIRELHHQRGCQLVCLFHLFSDPLTNHYCIVSMWSSELFSLLFQTAVHHAIAGHRVTFICASDIVDEGKPKLSANFNLKANESILKRIDMKYCGNLMELCQYLSHFHLFDRDDIPQVLIIHDMVRYLELSMFPDICDEDDGDKDSEDSEDDEDGMELSEDDEAPDKNNDAENENGADDGNQLEMELKMSMMDEERTAEFLDEKGRLEYDFKLTAFLPILRLTQETAANIMRGDGNDVNNGNNGNQENSQNLQEMICIIGMECLSGEFEDIYPLWRRWKFERFLRCEFNPKSNIIRIEYDIPKVQAAKENETDTDIHMKTVNHNRNSSKSKRPPAVHCFVEEQTMSMVSMKGRTQLARRKSVQFNV